MTQSYIVKRDRAGLKYSYVREGRQHFNAEITSAMKCLNLEFAEILGIINK